MPRNVLATPNSYESITRPIALEVGYQIARLLELPNNTHIRFPGGMEQLAQKGSTLGKELHDDDESMFQFDGQILMDIVERFNDDNVLSTTVHYLEDAEPYFNDPAIGVSLRPVYSHTTIDFNISVRCKDRDQARRFRDTILARSAMLRKENLHEFSYSFTVPPKHLLLLEAIHTLREKKAGYGEDFSTWVANHITGRATNLTTMIGTEPTLVIQENQAEVLGWFDWEAAPDNLEKDADGGTWQWTLTYKLNYDKVIGTAARWPISVHSQYLGAPWVSTPVANGTQIDPDRRPRRSGRITAALQHFVPWLYTDWCRSEVIDGIQYPIFDEWFPHHVKPDTSSVITALIEVDETTPRLVAELGTGDIDYIKIDPDVLAFLKKDHAYLPRYNESICHFALYEDDVELGPDALEIDADLNVWSTIPMNPRKVYHLRIALVNDLMGITRAARERFRSGGVGAQKILMTLQWKLLKRASLPPLLGGRWIALAYIEELAREINALKGIHYTGVEYRMLTVGYFTVVTQRRTEDAHRQTHPAGGTDSAGAGSDEGREYPVPGCDDGYPI